jgi:hypothetical protein
MPFEKLTVYVETTVIGHLVGRTVADVIVAGRQAVTRKWWPLAIERHRLFVSKLVLDECSVGDPAAAAERLAALASLNLLKAKPEVDDLAARLMSDFAIPRSEPRDAVHVSLAAVNDIEFLVSWNFKHIVNPATRKTIERVCVRAGFVPPIICTPDELQEIRRDP